MELTGIIVRRRSMGKNLAFADIKRICDDRGDPNVVDDNGSDVDHCVTKYDQHIKGNDDEGSEIIRVAFRRASPSWNKARDDTFPTKTSSLPYGAKVIMELSQCNSLNNDGKDHRHNRIKGLQREESVSERPHTPDSNAERKGRVSLEVCSWKIIENPVNIATETAKEQFHKRNKGISSDNGHGGFNKNGDDNDDGSGILCSVYLRARGDTFLKYNRHPHEKSNANVKSKSSQKILSHTEMEKIEGGIDAVQSCNNGGIIKNSPHGDKRAKALRAKIFASWILKTFDAPSLRKSSGVLDIAGGKGQLSVELSAMAQIPCTIIDPLVRGRNGRHRLLPSDVKRIKKVNGPQPCHIARPWSWDFVQDCSQREDLVQSASCMVGLHPDECTEDILDVALRYDKSVAIVPCCVFPSLFPMRRTGSDGRFVRTYEEFLSYLLEKDDRLKVDTLPFEGKNKVIYCKSLKKESKEINQINHIKKLM